MTGPSLPKALAHDWEHLTALVDHYGERQPIPCRSSNAWWWTSDDEGERAKAAAECVNCPALIQCRRYGLAHLRESGVYGGLTPDERRRVARESKEK